MEQKVKVFPHEFALLKSKQQKTITVRTSLGVEEADLLWFVEIDKETEKPTGREIYASAESVLKIDKGNSRITIDFHD